MFIPRIIFNLLFLIFISMNSSIKPFLDQAVKDQGVIILAHGASPRWNKEVLNAARELASQFPTIVVFGMADAAATQRATDSLGEQGVKKIVFIPLFISSHSELYRQTEFMLGLRKNPDPDFVEGMRRAMEHPIKFIWKKVSWANIPYALSAIRRHRRMACDQRISHKVPIELRPALDSSRLVGEIIEERALNLSENPAEEAVLIVAHGPIRDEDDKLWLDDMEKIAGGVRKYSFREVRVATMRDDAPDEIKNKALARMRSIVEEAAVKGNRVIVIPLLLARGGVEKEIHHILKGLHYTYDRQTLLPHKNVSQWLLESAGAEVSDPIAVPEFVYSTDSFRFGNAAVVSYEKGIEPGSIS